MTERSDRAGIHTNRNNRHEHGRSSMHAAFHAKEFESSRLSMQGHSKAGYTDMNQTL